MVLIIDESDESICFWGAGQNTTFLLRYEFVVILTFLSTSNGEFLVAGFPSRRFKKLTGVLALVCGDSGFDILSEVGIDGCSGSGWHQGNALGDSPPHRRHYSQSARTCG
ncbi:MAG: hypothetical protein U0R19_15940 [Bryobacteraceae bacterium]